MQLEERDDFARHRTKTSTRQLIQSHKPDAKYSRWRSLTSSDDVDTTFEFAATNSSSSDPSCDGWSSDKSAPTEGNRESDVRVRQEAKGCNGTACVSVGDCSPRPVSYNLQSVRLY